MILSLIDAQTQAIRQPHAYSVPNEAKLDSVRPGWYVKLYADPPGQMFWLLVTSVTPDGFAGNIASRPLTDAFGHGDPLACSRRNVMDAMPPL